MSLFTLDQCIICLRETNSLNISSLSDFSSEQNKKVKRNAEICKRFCILATRYLSLDIDLLQPEKTVKTKLTQNVEQVCDSCLPLLKSFCNLYNAWQYLQLKINWNLKQIEREMRKADEDDEKENGKNNRKMLQERLGKLGKSTKNIDEFREKFLAEVSQNSIKSFPCLELHRANIEGYPLPSVPSTISASAITKIEISPVIDVSLLDNFEDEFDSHDQEPEFDYHEDPFDDSTLNVNENNFSGPQMATCETIAVAEPELAAATKPNPNLETSHIKIPTDCSNDTKKFLCRHCKKSFDRIGALVLHEKFHWSSNATIKCSVCDKVFFSFQAKVQHEKEFHGIETTDLKLPVAPVPVVGSASGNNNNMILRKQKSSTRKRPTKAELRGKPKSYKCRFCNFRSAYSTSTREHERGHLGNRQMFTCHICTLTLSRLSSLKRHLQHMHNAKYKKEYVIFKGKQETVNANVNVNDPILGM